MPISSTKDILTFVNDLESSLDTVKLNLQTWQENKDMILSSVTQVEKNRVNAISAIVKSEDALAEINTATFGVVAAKGQRLTKLLNDLKKQVINIAANSNSTGGVGGGDPIVNEEVQNAIASVDFEIADGLKLDYRIRQIQENADVAIKEFIMPFKMDVTFPLTTNTITVPVEDGVVFIDGEVTVLDSQGEKGILGSNNGIIYGAINSDGVITLDEAPNQPIRLYFPVKLQFKDVPEDFVSTLINMVVSKTSPLMEMLLKFENEMSQLIGDVASMKGQNWTVDYSIMGNQQEIVKEAITPKGLSIQIQDGMVHALFSYNDHPYLDHFVLEKWDETQNTWVPADGEYGIISK